MQAPNFSRLAERAVTFDHCYVGSMPCMPARREIHTGRYNFLHRSWGPLEPFDDSMPELLKNHGVHTHLASDHYHYWEDGGCTYHTRYSTWDTFRGQEDDPWIGDLRPLDLPAHDGRRNGNSVRQNLVNRRQMPREEDYPQPKTFAGGLEFLHRNQAEDNWFLTIETFDPHEPYCSPQRYKDLYPHAYDGPLCDWPCYGAVVESPEVVEHLRYESAALHSMCDVYLGRVLDTMDELHLWDDTLLIVNTDHGFLLGEHEQWAKCCQPFYDEVAHTPLFIWDPRCACRGERRRSLTQTIDLAPTVLDYFGVEPPATMQGQPLRDTIAADRPVRAAALFGMFGAHVNCTDGRYVYMRGAEPDNSPLHEYTLMPTHSRSLFSVSELQSIELREPFSFTKGCRTMRIPGYPWVPSKLHETMLFDLDTDPEQQHPLQDVAIEARMIDHLTQLMQENDAPVEQFERIGLTVKC